MISIFFAPSPGRSLRPSLFKPLLMACALAFGVYFALPAQADGLFSLSSDKETYTEGETPSLQAVVVTKPLSPDFEFEVLSELNEEPIELERADDFEFTADPAGLFEGEYTWEARLVIQDKRYARDLKTSIAYFAGEIDEIDDLLNTETDPNIIAELEAAKARYQSLKHAAESELESIRTTVETANLQFTIQPAER